MTTKITRSFQKGRVLSISLAHLVHDLYTAFLAPVLPLLISKFNLSLSLAGFLTVIQRLPSLLNPLVGVIADRVSIRIFLIISPSVSAIVMSLLGLAPSYGALIILLLISGINATLFHVPGPVAIGQASGGQTGKGMSFFMLGGELARSIGPLVILTGISFWGLEGAYRLIPIGPFASILLFFKLRKIQTGRGGKQTRDKLGLAFSLKKVTPVFLLISATLFFRGFMKGALTTFLPTYLTIQGSSLWIAGISLSIVQLAGAVGTLLGGSLSDRIGRRKTLLIVAVFSPLLMVLFCLNPGIFSLPLMLLLGITIFAVGPVLLALVQDISTDRPSLFNGIYMGINFITNSLTVLILGGLGDWLGLKTTYIVAAVLSFAAIPFVMKIPETSPPDSTSLELEQAVINGSE